MGLFTSKYKGKYKKEQRKLGRLENKYKDLKSSEQYYKDQYKGTQASSKNPSGGTMQQMANERARQMAENRKNDLLEGRKYAEESLNRDFQGLAPEKRAALQFEGNKNVERQHMAANRQLLGEQAQRGILPKSGVRFAQQKELQRLANEGYGQVHRDLEKLNADLAMKKLAAAINLEQGSAAQSQLDRQMAIDELRLEEEMARQRRQEDKVNRLFSRL